MNLRYSGAKRGFASELDISKILTRSFASRLVCSATLSENKIVNYLVCFPARVKLCKIILFIPAGNIFRNFLSIFSASVTLISIGVAFRLVDSGRTPTFKNENDTFAGLRYHVHKPKSCVVQRLVFLFCFFLASFVRFFLQFFQFRAVFNFHSELHINNGILNQSHKRQKLTSEQPDVKSSNSSSFFVRYILLLTFNIRNSGQILISHGHLVHREVCENPDADSSWSVFRIDPE